MRDSATSTIIHYLEQAIERLELEDLDQSDLEKVKQKISYAEKELEKELE